MLLPSALSVHFVIQEKQLEKQKHHEQTTTCTLFPLERGR